MTELAQLTDLTQAMRGRLALAELLQRIVDHSAGLVAAPHVSVRLLADDGQLLATARSGAPLHLGGDARFRPGEGLVGWIARERQALRSDDAEADPRFVPRAGQHGRLGSFLGVPLIEEDACIGVLAAVHPETGYFSVRHEQLLTLVAGICVPWLAVARLQQLAQVDPLTGALNRHGLGMALGAAPADLPLSLVLADIDAFKQVNDGHGHAKGDEVLRAVARALQATVRAGDTVIRWGGEEFLLVLPGAAQPAAARVAERARLAVAAVAIDAAAGPVRVTLSAGVAERQRAESVETAIRRADAALYTAKRGGRDRVEVAE